MHGNSALKDTEVAKCDSSAGAHGLLLRVLVEEARLLALQVSGHLAVTFTGRLAPSTGDSETWMGYPGPGDLTLRMRSRDEMQTERKL